MPDSMTTRLGVAGALVAVLACFVLAYAGGASISRDHSATLASAVATQRPAASAASPVIPALGSAERLPIRLTAAPRRRHKVATRRRARAARAKPRRVVRVAVAPVQPPNTPVAGTLPAGSGAPPLSSAVAPPTAPARAPAPVVVARQPAPPPVRVAAPKPAAPVPAAPKPAPKVTFFDDGT